MLLLLPLYLKLPLSFSRSTLSIIRTICLVITRKSRMSKDSFELYPNYFQNLRDKTRKIDNGIDRLSETWKTPHLLVGGYAERSIEVDACLEELWKSIYDTNDAIKKSKMELEPSLRGTDQFLDEAQTLYEDLKAQCDNIDTVLAEYGYHYEEHKDSMLENRNNNKDCMDDRISNSKELEVEFTPNLTWKCKSKIKESDLSTSNQKEPIVKYITTPVIKSLASVSLSENYETENSLIRCTRTKMK